MTSGWVWLAIGLGSAVGGVLRHGLTEAVARVAGGPLPWGTIAVNASGSLAMGAVAALAAGAGGAGPWPPALRHAALTGLLGGFTTFSAFSYQTVELAAAGDWRSAGLNVGLSVAVCLVACWSGYAAVAGLGR